MIWRISGESTAKEGGERNGTTPQRGSVSISVRQPQTANVAKSRDRGSNTLYCEHGKCFWWGHQVIDEYISPVYQHSSTRVLKSEK